MGSSMGGESIGRRHSAPQQRCQLRRLPFAVAAQGQELSALAIRYDGGGGPGWAPQHQRGQRGR